MSFGNEKRKADLVREMIESYVPPATSSRVLFAALRSFGREPTEHTEMLPFIESVGDALHLQVDADTREAILERLRWMFTKGPASHRPPAVDDFTADLAGPEEDPTVTRTMPTSDEKPVPVLVASSDALLGSFLATSLGRHRIKVLTVSSSDELRHGVFAHSPLVVVVDGFEPPMLMPHELVYAAQKLPDRVISVLWGRDTPWGSPIAQGADTSRWVFLSEHDGFGPLLDVISSRYGGAT